MPNEYLKDRYKTPVGTALFPHVDKPDQGPPGVKNAKPQYKVNFVADRNVCEAIIGTFATEFETWKNNTLASIPDDSKNKTEKMLLENYELSDAIHEYTIKDDNGDKQVDASKGVLRFASQHQPKVFFQGDQQEPMVAMGDKVKVTFKVLFWQSKIGAGVKLYMSSVDIEEMSSGNRESAGDDEPVKEIEVPI